MLSPRIQRLLIDYDDKHLLRKRHTIEWLSGNQLIIADQACINFCSNDYLHVAQHPQVKKALAEGAQRYGLGSSGSALVSGHTRPHRLLEDAFADFTNRESALLFNSGYHANLGVLTTFADKNSTIIADKASHASLIDGILLSQARHYRYRHHDLQHAETLLKKNKTATTLLVSESIFSIQGDIANIKALATLASKYNAMLVIDDAHGVGILNENSSQQDIPCLITPLGKAFGSLGAIVSGSQTTIQALVQFARTYRYSTAIPAAVCWATLAALNIIKQETWRRHQLHALIHFFIKEARKRELHLYSTDLSPIKSILTGSNRKALVLQKKLLQDGFFVSCIRPPTVPIGKACLRISLNCMHTKEQILHLLDKIKLRLDSHE